MGEKGCHARSSTTTSFFQNPPLLKPFSLRLQGSQVAAVPGLPGMDGRLPPQEGDLAGPVVRRDPRDARKLEGHRPGAAQRKPRAAGWVQPEQVFGEAATGEVTAPHGLNLLQPFTTACWGSQGQMLVEKMQKPLENPGVFILFCER